MSGCCARLAQENARLLRLVEKERQRRRYVSTAYKKLLAAYQAVVDFREVFESTVSDAGDEEEEVAVPTDGVGRVREAVVTDEKENASKAQLDVSERPRGNDSRVAMRPIQSTPVPSTVVEGGCKTLQLVAAPDSKPHRQQPALPAWYFVEFEGSAATAEHASLARRLTRLRTMLAKSEKRGQLIAETSQRRAQIAAHRRAVAMDLLKGRRELDDEALAILQTDSSRLCAFPPEVMREMRAASRRRSRQFALRLELEGGNRRERQLQMATNKILAHSSAIIAKGAVRTPAYARCNGVPDHEKVQRHLTRSLSSITLGGGCNITKT